MNGTGEPSLKKNTDQLHNDDDNSDQEYEDALREFDTDQLAPPDSDQTLSEYSVNKINGTTESALKSDIDQTQFQTDEDNKTECEEASNQTHSDVDVSSMECENSSSNVDIDMKVTTEGNAGALNNSNDELQETLVKKLGLSNYFPGKISLQDVMLNSSGKLESLHDIPWYILSKILMLDSRARDDIFSESIKKSFPTHENQNLSDIDVDDCDKFLSQFTNLRTLNETEAVPHPLDVFLVTFISSSNFLRQILCEKLFMCKLSIPLVIPPVYNHESMFFLWSLRSIALECKLPNDEHCEISAVRNHIPIVSCIRLGEISRSKSKFLNEILNEESHPTFFHRDCLNGMNQRILSEGLLEIAWCFPSDCKKNCNSINVDVAFANLRGDGSTENTRKSKRFLCNISSVVLVLVDVSKLDDVNIYASLEEIASSSSQMLLMVTKARNSQLNKKDCGNIKKCKEILEDKGFEKSSLFYDFDGKGERNIKHLKKETEDKINRCLEKCPKKTSIESYKTLAEKLDISVDENILECSKSKSMALKIRESVCKRGTDNLKADNLPLQCKPWQEWAKLNTEEHRREKRGTDNVADYMDKLSVKLKNFRQEQLQLLEKPNIITNVFIDCLSNSVREKNLYFLKWLKIYLDEISKEILPGFQKKCSEKWDEIRSCEDETKLKTLQAELNECEEKLAEASFGLEHFMREIAQAYEAVSYMGKNTDGSIAKKINMLPRIMAELILLGYPFEIMDGDAAHVPLKWVQAVLKELSNLIGKKKIFILSVLGIQSSGKSTLLNTMFGLQFSVAAGRCTRGVYAQLVPLCKEYSRTGYNYILVVDTEGLRAAELGKTKFQHDNEIATLVIGLGDVTLVNVKGENISEMEDVLQIVIHALLKMCLVNKNLSLQPSCIFIHQNVSATDASQKLRTGQQKFVETLDKVTRAAGKQEDAPEYTKFKQLIQFDINTDISYVSDLWKGDPPMAPANPGYSENVNKVKQTLLTKIMQNRSLQLTAEKFSIRLKDLWHGILDQNFVFSFKNSLELDAYSSLEKKLSDVIWSLKKTALDWSNIKIIDNTENDLKKLGVSLITECRSEFHEKNKEAQETMQDFFASNEDKSLLEQWRTSTFLRLNASYDDIVDRTIKNIKDEIGKKQIKVEEQQDMQKYVNEIMDEAKTLAEDLRSHGESDLFGDEKLNCLFREKWNEWMKKLPPSTNEDINVEESINNILDKTFRHELPLLNIARDKRCDKITADNFAFAIHTYVSDVNSWYKRVKRLFNNKKDTGMKFLEELLNDVEEQMIKTSEQRTIHEGDVQSIITKVSKTVKEMKSSLSFNNEKKFEICLALFLSQHICCKYSRKWSFGTEDTGYCELAKFGIQPIFRNVLTQKFSHKIFQVIKEIRVRLSQQSCSKDFNLNIIDHIKQPRGSYDVRNEAECLVKKIFEQVQLYITKSEIQCFREEYIDEIIHKIRVMESNTKDIAFTKTFRIDLALFLSLSAVPILSEKHKRYVEDMDQRLVYERDNYGSCLEKFKSFYFKFTGEQAVAQVLSERITKAIENAVDRDMSKELASDVRNNVPNLSCKPAFLKAVLCSLLEEDDFEHFYLYLNDTEACFDFWLTQYVNSYLFRINPNGLNRYSEIAFRKIESLVSTVCEEISKTSDRPEEHTLRIWIEDFRQQLNDKLSLPLNDLLSLVIDYDISSLESVAAYLCKTLKENKGRLKQIFQNHKSHHQKTNHEINVYTLIGEECKGCTEKCPFCHAPCYLNNAKHTEAGVQHMAIEHHPKGCGRYRYVHSEKLSTENCPTSVAGIGAFKNADTNKKYHPFKNYKDLYPYWDIPGDPSVEASPYWKWFLAKYAEQLADRYKAEVPDIPKSFFAITKEKALESLGK